MLFSILCDYYWIQMYLINNLRNVWNVSKVYTCRHYFVVVWLQIKIYSIKKKIGRFHLFFKTETEWWHHCKWYHGGGKPGGDPDLCDRWHWRGSLRGTGKWVVYTQFTKPHDTIITWIFNFNADLCANSGLKPSTSRIRWDWVWLVDY